MLSLPALFIGDLRFIIGDCRWGIRWILAKFFFIDLVSGSSAAMVCCPFRLRGFYTAKVWPVLTETVATILYPRLRMGGAVVFNYISCAKWE